MPTRAAAVIQELKCLGREGYRRILLNHGAHEPCLGVKIEDLKKIQRRVRGDHQLALELYATGVYDAMYLAGLIADPLQMTKADLRRWARQASWPLAGAIVAGVAAGSRHGWELAQEWIESPRELIAAAGWATFAAMVSVTDDTELDQPALAGLLQRVERDLPRAPNAVRYQMNGFVIALGSFVPAFTARARAAGIRLGRVTVDLGSTACEVPYAPDYLHRMEQRGVIGRKRKSAIC